MTGRTLDGRGSAVGTGSDGLDGSVVLSVRGLRTSFPSDGGRVVAVDDVSFDLHRGEVLGIVGESGSGKSATALSIMRLLSPPARVSAESLVLDGLDLAQLSEGEMRRVRGSQIGLIVQDPMTSLNPVLSVGDQLVETLRTHTKGTANEQRERAIWLLRRVRIAAPEEVMKAYPHQLSGGMRQRVLGALAISCEPKVLIADEPTTALDATTQLQYLQLLRTLQLESSMSVVFITHDFGVVATVCDRVAVMYAGRLVEVGDVATVFVDAEHPYTRGLLAAVPGLDGDGERLPTIPGQPPALDNLPTGCSFAPRCPLVHDRCERTAPNLSTVTGGHTVACWASEESR